MNNYKNIELLAPAGNFEKLKYAIRYGADAVYCGVPDFSLRVRINQFTKEQLEEAVRYVHQYKKRIYVTLNIYAHNRHIEELKKHLKHLSKLDIDGVIVSDPGIINLVKKYLPEVEIHLSTQANATNYEAVKFWKSQGVKRVILAREVTLEEIREIKDKTKGVELEAFIHGAMCMSYSGRCILSKWMSNRSANLGDCTQPCRWEYKIKNKKQKIKNSIERDEFIDLEVEEKMKGTEISLEEDRHGTYFFNSYDLNLIDHVDKLINSGLDSLKIEGRAKSAYYLAVVVRAYRKVIDALEQKVSKNRLEKVIKEQKKELDNLVHRGYTTGFLLGGEPDHNYEGKLHGGDWEFVGEIAGQEGKMNIVKIHNALLLSDKVEVVTPDENISIKVKRIIDWNGKEVEDAHGGHDKKYLIEFDRVLEERDLIRIIHPKTQK